MFAVLCERLPFGEYKLLKSTVKKDGLSDASKTKDFYFA
jgi:hypothetical protein